MIKTKSGIAVLVSSNNDLLRVFENKKNNLVAVNIKTKS
jgi:hypothetical protein